MLPRAPSRSLAWGLTLVVLASGAGVAHAAITSTRIRDRIALTDRAGRVPIARDYRLRCSSRDDARAHLLLYAGTPSAHWEIDAPVAYLRRHPRLRLPEHARSGAILFAAARRNEASSSEEEATGTIVTRRISCSHGPEIDMTVDARLGSEFFEQPSIRMTGSIRAYAPPR